MIDEVRRALGCPPTEAFEPMGLELATTDVWRSDQSVVKRMRSHGKLRNELEFYRKAASFLPARTAALLGHCREPLPCIRLSRLAGELVAATPGLQSATVYRTAAKAIRALHDAPYEDTDTLSLDDALDARFAGWFPRFRAVAPEELIASVTAYWLARPPLEFAKRCRTHRDYSDRNWLWHPESETPLGVFDFEQSRPDHPWMDATRLWERDFHGRSDLADAFLDGYGGPNDLLRHPDFRSLAVLHALATVAWSTETGDLEYAGTGAAALRRVLRGS